MMKPILKCPDCQSANLFVSDTKSVCNDCGYDLTILLRLKNEAEILIRAASEKRANGQLIEALLLARDALDIDNSRREFHLFLGIVYQELNMFDHARQLLSRYISDEKLGDLVSLLLNSSAPKP